MQKCKAAFDERGMTLNKKTKGENRSGSRGRGSKQQSSSQSTGQYNQQGNYQNSGQYNQQGNYQNNGQYNQQGNYQNNGQYNQQGNYQNNGQYNQQGNYQNSGQYNQQGYNPNGGQYSQQQYYGQPQQGYPQYNNDQNGGKKKKKKRHRLRFALEVIVLLIVALGIAAVAFLSRMDREKLSDILVNTGVTSSGYQNIAIFGVDSREGELDAGTRSDTIIVASINKKNGDIKLVSVYRDTYLDNTDGSYRKATEAYEAGGPSLAVNMLNKNLDLDIKDYVTVDFEAVIECVDELGGIEITLTDEEVTWLNAYLVETSEVTGRSYTEVPYAGTQNLTGIQAMAYCRIRYTEGWDYKRTERQRDVITQIFKKAQSQGIASLASVINNMMPYISTSLSNTELLSLASGISKYEIVDSQGFPFNSTTADLAAGDCVVPINLADNVTQLHELLFNESYYTPSATVEEISDYIIASTGIA